MKFYSITLDSTMIFDEIPEDVRKLKELQERGFVEIFATDEDLNSLAIEHLTAHPTQKRIKIDFNQIKEILYPGKSKEELDFEQLRYVMFIAAHIIYKRDLFVTKNEILNNRKRELERLDVKIMTPEECYKFVNS